jgi:hypothetical protein
LWCIGLLGSIIVIYHNNSDEDNACNAKMDDSSQKITRLTLLSLDPDAVAAKRNKIIAASYILNIRNMINEIATIICMPWILFQIRREILRRKEIYKILDYNPILGMMCKYAIFANCEFMTGDLHMLLAYYNFRMVYPDCSLGVILDWNSNNVRKISEITGNRGSD